MRQTKTRIAQPLIAALALAICLLLAITAGSPTHVTAQAGSPSNDTCAGAIPLTLNIPVTGSTVGALNDYQLSGSSTCFTGVGADQAIGQISSAAAGRDVVYSFTAPTTGAFSVRVTDYAAADLVLYTATSCPSGGPPATVTTCQQAANRTLNRAEEVFNLSLAAGQQIFIFVDEHAISVSGDGSFTIEVNAFGDEREVIDSFLTNNLIGIVGAQGFGGIKCPFTAVTRPGNDPDFFGNFQGTTNRIFALVDGVAANDDDFNMRVVNGTVESTLFSTLEVDDADNVSRFGANSPNIAGRSLNTVVQDSSVLNKQVNALLVTQKSSIPSGPYRLYMTTANDLARIPESEPNNSAAQADTATSNYFSGVLSGSAPSTDMDFYGFTARAGDLVFLSLDGDPLRNLTPINAKLELLDTGGNTLVSVNDSNASSFNLPGFGLDSSSPAEGLVFRARNDGIYFAKVSIGTTATDSTGEGDYILSITKNCGPGGGGSPGQLQFSASSYSVNESGGNATVTVSRINGSDGEVRVNYATSDDTAIAGQDYKETAGTLIFAQGVTSQTFTVPINNDTLDEAAEKINLTLNNPSGGAGIGATLGTTPTAVLTITDDDPQPTLTIQSKSVSEGDPGDNHTARFTIRLSTVSGQAVGVVASTANDATASTPATAGTDYVASSSAVVIPAGSTTGFFDVSLIGDRIGEPNETFLVNLFNDIHATIVTGQAVGTILNDDFIDTVGVSRPTSGQFLLRNTNTTGSADIVVPFGGPGTKPVAGDWDGDGIDDVGFFNPSTHQFSLRQPITVLVGVVNGVPVFTTSITVITINFGQNGDLPVVGDWNGDGIDTVGVYRPGTGSFFLTNSPSSPVPPVDITFGLGTTGDQPIAGDWNGDGIDTVGLFRPSTNFFFLSNSFATVVDISFPLGTTGDLPLAGDWNGDSIDTVGLFRPTSGAMFLSNVFATAVNLTFNFGQSGDMPIAGNWSRKPGDNNPPNSGVNNPGEGSNRAGQVQLFTTTCSDPDGWHDIHTIDFKISKSNGNGNGVPVALWVQFLEDRNLIRFYDPDTQAWSEGAPGSSVVLSSRFAELHLAETGVQGSGPIGPSVQIKWTVVFKGAAAMNNYKQYLQITDDAGLSTGFDSIGSWSVLR